MPTTIKDNVVETETTNKTKFYSKMLRKDCVYRIKYNDKKRVIIVLEHESHNIVAHEFDSGFKRFTISKMQSVVDINDRVIEIFRVKITDLLAIESHYIKCGCSTFINDNTLYVVQL